MAKLRRLGNAFAAASPILGHFRDQQIAGNEESARLALQRLMNEQDNAQSAANAQLSATTSRDNAAAGEAGQWGRFLSSNPTVAERFTANNANPVGPGVDLNSFTRPLPERLAPLRTAISGADTLEKIPTPLDIRANAESAGVTDQPSIDSLIAQAEARRAGQAAIFGTKKVADLTQYDPANGSQFRQVDGQRYQTAPTAVQAGHDKLTESLNNELSPEHAVAAARVQNEFKRMTADQDAMNAATTAGATRRAELAPDIVNSEVDRAQRIAKANTQGSAGGSQGERQAASMIPSLMDADARALGMEKKGAFITPTSLASAQSLMFGAAQNAASKIPLIGSFLDNSPETKAYTQQAINYANVHARIMSGQTVRPDEFPRYLNTFFANAGDSPAMVAQKQKSRAVFTAAATASAGRSKDEVGQMLGREIQAGNLLPDVLGLSLDPAIKDAILRTPFSRDVAERIQSVLNLPLTPGTAPPGQ